MSWMSIALFALSTAVVASAGSITYTESATATGTLGVNSFTNAPINLSFLGDTSNVSALDGGLFLFTSPGTVTLNITGLAAATLSGLVFDSQASNPNFPSGIAAGFSFTGGGSILDTYNSAFASYNLTSSIGPLPGASFFRPDLTYATSMGGLNITSAGSSAFSAVLGTATPEPLSAMLMLAGLTTLIACARSKKAEGGARP